MAILTLTAQGTDTERDYWSLALPGPVNSTPCLSPAEPAWGALCKGISWNASARLFQACKKSKGGHSQASRMSKHAAGLASPHCTGTGPVGGP